MSSRDTTWTRHVVSNGHVTVHSSQGFLVLVAEEHGGAPAALVFDSPIAVRALLDSIEVHLLEAWPDLLLISKRGGSR